MEVKALKKKLTPIFHKYPSIKLVYFFGSRVRGEIGPLSDYDLAVYVDEKDKKKIFEIRLELIATISRVLKTDKIDVVALNTLDAPELKYNIIKEGELIFEKKPFKVLVEPKILNEYFDFRFMLKQHHLTKA